MLKLRDLTFSHPGQDLPNRYDLELEAGRILAVTGPSGAGKSTLLDLIAGFLQPDSGSLTLDGKDLLSLPVEKRPVSILFQANNLFDHLSVERNILLGIGHPDTDGKQVATRALKEVGLASFGKRRASDLSGGQQQRVALARTLVHDRPVMLLDEPFANLDEETADRMRQLVATLTRRQNWHTIIVSHLTRDVETLADEIYPLSWAS